MSKLNKKYLLKNYITNKNIEVGDYTYYYSFEGLQALKEFQNKNVMYHFPEFLNEKLIIGKFCAIAENVKIIMSGANHRINSLSTFPFEMFNELGVQVESAPKPVSKGDTIIGNDVWIGYGATIMPGIKIGNGAIIGAKSVVVRNVEPYTIVAGNPATIVKKRFKESTISKLENLKWWDLPIDKLKPLLKNLMKEEELNPILK